MVQTSVIPLSDKKLLRELAKKYRELSGNAVNQERIQRIRDMHNLIPVRPPVWIDEIPWHEMDINGELTLGCESDEGRKMEQFFRRILFRWKYFQVDMVVEEVYYINKAYTDSGFGLTVKEETASTNPDNNIISHQYEDQLDTEAKVDALTLPCIEAHPDIDKKNWEIAADIFNDILPVKFRGHIFNYCPWDQIARYRGIGNCLIDMIDNPGLIHKTITKFNEIYSSRLVRMEALGLLDFNIPSLHCTPPYCDDVPAKDFDGVHIRLNDLWFRGMAQLFSSASPQMQDEFDLQYMRPVMEQCAASYYGCCEPLDKLIPYLKKISNLRKIGVSPWADVRSSAEQIGGNYVLARKPNPALVSGNFNREAVEKEITQTIEVCMENKCPYEFVLKDISTAGGRPQNLIEWAKTVSESVDSYYC
jgi:hypothetical protein